jgi:hypothetical protein
MTKIAADLQKQLKRARHLKGSGRDWEFYKEQERLRRERELAHADFDMGKECPFCKSGESHFEVQP